MRTDLSKIITKYAKNVLVIILIIQICILSMGANVIATGETKYPALIYDSDDRKENVDEIKEELDIEEVDSVSIEDCLAKFDDSKVDQYANYLKEVIEAEYRTNENDNSLSSAINYFACDTKKLNDVLYNMGNPSAGNPIPKSETFVNGNNKTSATIYNMKKAMWMLMQYVYYGEDVDNIDKSMLSNGYFQFSVEEGFGAEWYYVDSISGETYSKIWNTLANKGILEKTRQELKKLHEEDPDIASTYDYYKYFGFGEDSPDEEPIVGVTDEEWENQNQENKDDYLNFDSAEGEVHKKNNDNKLLEFLDGIAGVLFIGWKIIPIIIGGAIDGIMNAANGQTVTIDSILFNEVEMTKINFFEKAPSGNNKGTIDAIRTNVSIWYISLRNLAAIILVFILIYVAIRMAISTVAEEKAKYKRMLVDWITSLCILFVLHYIIVLVINLNNSFVDLLGIGRIGADIGAAEGILLDNAWSNISFVKGVGNAIAYMMLAGMTFIYFLAYVKRMITIAFLIIIAPLITITYSIDKMGDGKSQALNTWLKEFTYNILIQPFQCIIYISLGSAALSLLGDANLFNVIIAIYIFIFMFQAEEIVKNIFGFKANSMAKTIAGAAITGAIISKGTSLFSGKDKEKKKDAGSGYKPRPATKNSPDLQDNNANNILAGGGGNAVPPGQAPGAGNTNGNTPTVRRTRDEVEKAYSEDGFGKNNNGEYFNPWTDEYDKNYDPMNDPEYQNKKVSAQTANNSQGPTPGQTPNTGNQEEDLYTFRRPVQPTNQSSTMAETPKKEHKIAGAAKTAGKWLLRHNLTGGLKAAGLGLGLSSGDLKSGIAGWGLGSAQSKKIDDTFEKRRTKSNERTRFSRIANSIDDFQGDMSNTQALQKMNDYLDGISMPDRDDEAGLRLYQQLSEEMQIQKDLGKSDDEAREIVNKVITDSLSGAQSRVP